MSTIKDLDGQLNRVKAALLEANRPDIHVRVEDGEVWADFDTKDLYTVWRAFSVARNNVTPCWACFATKPPTHMPEPWCTAVAVPLVEDCGIDRSSW